VTVSLTTPDGADWHSVDIRTDGTSHLLKSTGEMFKRAARQAEKQIVCGACCIFLICARDFC
jgi:hypothetical protein